MAYIRPLNNGSFRADIRMKGIIKNKTFPSRSLAEEWAILCLCLPDPAACIFEAMNFDYLNEQLFDAITDIAGEKKGSINRRRLGWLIKRHAGRVVNGMRLVPDSSN